MRVLQMIDEMRLGGGAEQLQCSLAAAVRGSGVELVVLTLHENEARAEAELRALGATVVSLPSRRFASPTRAVRLARFVRSGDFDVIHTHLVRSTILGALVGRAAGIPVVTTLHNTRPSIRLPRVLRALETLVLRSVVDRVVAVGWETAAANRPRLGATPVEVIPNAVAEIPALAATERDAARKELGVEPDEVLAMAVGRLHPQKAYGDLLAAFERVCRNRRARLCIVGRGGEREAIEAEVARLGLGERVTLLGLRRDVPRLLGASDLYVSASAWEGLPVATLEAMAAGLPVVATSVGDVPRVLDADAGTLVPAGRPEELALALDRVLGDPALRARHGKAARRRVREHFGADAWSARLLALYRRLCHRDRAAQPSARAATEEDSCESRW